MQQKSLVLTFVLFVALLCGATPHFIVQANETAVDGTAIYVATDGSDSNGDGSFDRPYGSLQKAASTAAPGNTVYVRGGVYHQGNQTIKNDGAANKPITFKPYNNEEVIFDAQGLSLDDSDGVIAIQSAKYIVVEGFEVRNSSGRGITFYESEHIVVRNNNVHHVRTRAIGGSGKHVIIEGNRVWEAVLENENNKYNAVGGWAAAVATWTYADGSPSEDFVIRNNFVSEVWGEAIMAVRVVGMEISGNTVRNPYSVGIYLNKLEDVVVNGNHIFITDNRFNRSDRDYPGHGINIANENARSSLPRTSNLVLSNNLIVGTGVGIRYWHDERSSYADNNYRDLQIVNNVIYGTHEEALYFDDIPSNYNQPTNASLHNNILFEGKNGQTIYLGDPGAWTISHNNWPDGVPSMAREANSFSETPQFVDPNPVGGPDGFKLHTDSSSIGRGIYVSAVGTDFWGNSRPAQPTLGISENNAGGNGGGRAGATEYFMPLIFKNS